MASLNEIAYDLFSIVRPHISDDSNIDIRQIKFWINNQRSLWLRNELNKTRSIDPDLIQTLCVELETVDASDCCGVELGCSILKSVKAIPDTIELHHTSSITRVGPINKKKKPFSFVDYSRVAFLGNGRFTQNHIYSFLHDHHMYVFTKNPAYKELAVISVRGVFEDPTDVAAFNDCDSDEPCYTDDMEYPMKSWMIPQLKEAILRSNLMIQAQAEVQQVDDSNNAKSDVKQS